MKDSKREFIEKYCTSRSMKDVLTDYLNNLPQETALVTSAYDNLTKINARTTGDKAKPINIQDSYKFFKDVFDNFLYYMSIKYEKGLLNKDEERSFAYLLNMKNSGMLDKIDLHDHFFGDDQSFSNKGMYAQNEVPIFTKRGVVRDFVHVSPFKMKKEIDCRLYLNLDADNIIKVSSAVMEKCKNDRKRLYFKFYTADDRTDNFLIYTNYDEAQYFVDTLKEIKEKNPEWFTGCEKTNPGLNMIEDFIGFGEEPKYKRSSFNSERASVINEYLKTQLADYRKELASGKITFKNRYNEELDIKDYIKYRTKEDIIVKINEELYKDEKDIEYINDTKRYKELLTKVKDVITSGNIPSFMTAQIEKFAQDSLQKMQNGESPNSFILEIWTKKPGIAYSEDHDNQKIKKIGHATVNLYVGYKLEEKLFNVHGVREKLKNNIDEDLLKNLCEKQHISYDHVALNTETIKEIEEEKQIKNDN